MRRERRSGGRCEASVARGGRGGSERGWSESDFFIFSFDRKSQRNFDKMSSRYESLVKHLFNVSRFSAIKLGLQNTERLAELLGNPERTFRTVHVWPFSCSMFQCVESIAPPQGDWHKRKGIRIHQNCKRPRARRLFGGSVRLPARLDVSRARIKYVSCRCFPQRFNTSPTQSTRRLSPRPRSPNS